MPKEKLESTPKEILIELDDGRLRVPEKVHVQRSQTCRWKNGTGVAADFEIVFAKESPFDVKSLDGPAARVGKKARPDAILGDERRYKYSVRANGLVLDPVIIVDPDPPTH